MKLYPQVIVGYVLLITILINMNNNAHADQTACIQVGDITSCSNGTGESIAIIRTDSNNTGEPEQYKPLPETSVYYYSNENVR